jgi:hypothetical protein
MVDLLGVIQGRAVRRAWSGRVPVRGHYTPIAPPELIAPRERDIGR